MDSGRLKRISSHVSFFGGLSDQECETDFLFSAVSAMLST